MKTKNFKYLSSLILILGIFLAGCDNSTDPISGSESIKKAEYTPTVAQAKEQSESVLKGVFKSVANSKIGSTLLGNNLSKSNTGISYAFLNNWHTWRADMDHGFEGFDDVYHLEYISKVQFLNETNAVQALPTDASKMFISLRSHGSFGFIGEDPRGDEVWFNYGGNASPLKGNPSMVNLGGNYERRWVGEYSEDGENWELIEYHYNVEFGVNNVEFIYSSLTNDFYLNGTATFYMNGLKLLARFSNSRTAVIEVYNGTSTSSLVDTYQFELPNFYQAINIPSLNNWDFNLAFVFPTPIVVL